MVRFACGFALRNLWRNAVMSSVAIGTTALLLLVLSTMLILVAGLDAAVSAVESRVNVIAYLKDGTTDEARSALQAALLARGDVATVTYVDKEQALARLREQFAGHPELLGAIEGNPLPASLAVTLRDPRAARAIGAELAADPSVSDVAAKQETVDRLVAASHYVRLCGFAVVFGLGIAVIFVMVNVARVGIYGRRHEIAVMRLVGASGWFIRWPFVLEGMFCGLLAAAVALAVVAGAYQSLLGGLRGSLAFLPLRLDPHLVPRLLTLACSLGVGVGGGGSLIAVHRFWEK